MQALLHQQFGSISYRNQNNLFLDTVLANGDIAVAFRLPLELGSAAQLLPGTGNQEAPNL